SSGGASESGSVVSACTTVMPTGISAGIWRTIPVTTWPRASSSAAIREPTRPVTPISAIFMVGLPQGDFEGQPAKPILLGIGLIGGDVFRQSRRVRRLDLDRHGRTKGVTGHRERSHR